MFGARHLSQVLGAIVVADLVLVVDFLALLHKVVGVGLVPDFVGPKNVVRVLRHPSGRPERGLLWRDPRANVSLAERCFATLPVGVLGATRHGCLPQWRMAGLKARIFAAFLRAAPLPIRAVCPPWHWRLSQESVSRLELMLRRVVSRLELGGFTIGPYRRNHLAAAAATWHLWPSHALCLTLGIPSLHVLAPSLFFFHFAPSRSHKFNMGSIPYMGILGGSRQ